MQWPWEAWAVWSRDAVLWSSPTGALLQLGTCVGPEEH
jgi:hypothetical protein